MGAGAETWLDAAVLWLRGGGLVWILLGTLAIAVVVLAVRVWQSRRRGHAEAHWAECDCGSCEAYRYIVGAAREPWDAHVWHVNGIKDPTCGQCASTFSLVSLTEAMSRTPWPPYRELPNDVMGDIKYVSYEETLMGRLLRLRLSGGEEVRIVENLSTDLNAEVVQAVRKVQENRAKAALDAATEITDPVVAGMALTLLDMAATRTDCDCCTRVPGGCVLPPRADIIGGRCTYTTGCACWGGLATDGRRYCEDCYQVATQVEPLEDVQFAAD